MCSFSHIGVPITSPLHAIIKLWFVLILYAAYIYTVDHVATISSPLEFPHTQHWTMVFHLKREDPLHKYRRLHGLRNMFGSLAGKASLNHWRMGDPNKVFLKKKTTTLCLIHLYVYIMEDELVVQEATRGAQYNGSSHKLAIADT